MRIEKYNSAHYPALACAARQVGAASLLRRDFVDFYYDGQPWNELYLALDDHGQCEAFIGVDRLRFELAGEEIMIGMATNFYTLKPGLGGFVWLQWMKSCPQGLVYGGSEDSHKILKRQKFEYFSGVHTYSLNAKYTTFAADPIWKKVVKNGLRKLTQKKLSRLESMEFHRRAANITVREVSSAECSPIEESCFSFRFAPSSEYLQWRYDSSLSLVHYRWFEIYEKHVRVGYCILNNAPDSIIVAHSDGKKAEALAYGTMKAIFQASAKDKKNRTATLASSHPGMQQIFLREGFELTYANRPVAIGSLRSKVALPSTEEWLINFGLGDNDLRPSTFYGSEYTRVAGD